MIEHKEALSMIETSEFLKNKDAKSFIKNFIKIKEEKAKELKQKIENLNLIKLNSRGVSKIIDFLPEDKEDLNKILADVSLDENETNKLLQTIKEFT